MRTAALRRIFGLLSGTFLIAAGSAEIAISRGDASVQAICRYGLCADQFSPERIFDISQKVALGDARGELKDFQQAVRLSPASAYRWADLGEAEFNVRDYAQAQYAFSQALKAGPRNPAILMRAANAEFQMGDTAGVLRHLRSILSNPELSDYYDTAFLTYSRADVPIDSLLRDGMPRLAEPLSRLLTFWTKMNRTEEAIATWKWSRNLGLTEAASAAAFFRFLLRAGDTGLAQQLWQEYAVHGPADYPTRNAVFNGGFERAFEPSPFDWTIEGRQDVEVIRSQDAAHTGAWSLRMRFNGESNTAYRQAGEEMVLNPGRYRFSAQIKTDHVTTDEGIRFHILDRGELDVWTETVTGTQDWKELQKDFEVVHGGRATRVELVRQMSTMFDNKIGGTTWIDDVRIARQ